MRAKKSLGQHWLENEAALDAICDSANVKTGDIVLEVGPGQGSLTAMLLERGANVVAVELDESLAESLKNKFAGLPFILNVLSILDFDLSQMPPNYKIVANPPYYLTAHLLRMLSETQHKPSVAVLLVQKEVAERVAAKPGQLSALAVLVQLSYLVNLGRIVPAKLFKPTPKVDSQILILNRRDQPLYMDIDSKKFMRVVWAGFSEKRKKLKSSLSGGLSISKVDTEVLLQKADVDSNRRAQELSLAEWHRIYKIFEKIYFL